MSEPKYVALDKQRTLFDTRIAMIIPTPDAKVRLNETAGTALDGLQADESGPRPPAYSELPPPVTQHEDGLDSPSGVAKPLPPPPTRPTNHLSLVKKDDNINGSYYVDPSMVLPVNVLPPLRKDETEETRTNLYLMTKDGHIDADVWIRGREEGAVGASEKRTRVEMHTKDGWISTRIIPVGNIAPFHLKLYSSDGRITIAIPRSFHGPLILSASHDKKSTLSPALLAESTPIGHHERTARYIVGDIGTWKGDEWAGDEVHAETKDGSIRVRYVDEDAAPLSMFESFGRMIGIGL
ncbi:hypothetical protein CONPUDRAFT_146324 [Coniophora puteana RWD-64-598 SS2]|uniref:DUF7330 domain-containing protein n=1 Tax=Coniophora puteana (strain RWD-64-598) TaxID=741705 RepID=A0A5M3MDK6_CONPW|nr:uncharacterized protein CONPUDRAFT_146324 [Coniophora puteana RWD-64-598 SS2]EIW77342.1 hypothetical protein CONPUDRAFT_146324 [Coniophora puteana RWD-64-598 SS2]